MIDKEKCYRTVCGLQVRIYCTDAGGDLPVHGAILKGYGVWHIARWDANGRYTLDVMDHVFDLVEKQPYDDFKVDDRVVVWKDDSEHDKRNRHFAGVSSIGKPMTFPDGKTSWSSKGTPTIWDQCVKAEEYDGD